LSGGLTHTKKQKNPIIA